MNRDWAQQTILCKKLKSDEDEADYYIKRQCVGKIQHKTLEVAEKEALRMTARYKMEKVFRAYHCDYCLYFHIGRKFED